MIVLVHASASSLLQSNRKALQSKLQERQLEVRSKAEQLTQEEKVAYTIQFHKVVQSESSNSCKVNKPYAANHRNLFKSIMPCSLSFSHQLYSLYIRGSLLIAGMQTARREDCCSDLQR